MSMGAKILAAFAVGMAIIAAIGGSAYVSTQRLLEANRWVTHTHQVIEGLQRVRSALEGAETGQRGFVLTGEERYLAPYNAAAGQIGGDIDALAALTRDNPAQQASLQQVRKLADAKLAQLRETIELRRKSRLQAALPVVLIDRGKKIMDDLRDAIAEMGTREQRLLDARNDAANAAANRTLWTITVWMPLALLALAVAAVVLMRSVQFGGPAAPYPHAGKKWGGAAVRYAAAVVVVAVAAALQMRLNAAIGPMPTFIAFYPAVLLVASIGGGGPGILATVLSALAADYWFIPPYGTLRIDAANDALALAIFTAFGLFLSILAERLRRSRWAEATSVAQAQQVEELSSLNEELSQQSEELSQQSEELAQQNEELQTQSEEIHSLNAELTHREDVLQKLLDAVRLSSGEQAVMQDICAAGKEMFGPAVSAVIVYERQGGRLAVRAEAGLGPEGAGVESWPVENSFADLVIAEDKTACLPDASLRPDIALVHPRGEQPFQAVLAAPMRRDGGPFGAVGVYSRQKQEWTAEQFRLAEWLAAQCAHVLETLRLQEELARSAAIVESSDDAILSKDLHGVVQTWNAGAERLFGYRAEEVVGQPIALLLPPERVDEEEQILQRVLSGQRVEHMETVRLAKDGSRLDVSVTVSPVKDGDGRIIGASKIVRDIGDRKRAEEAMRGQAALLGLAHDAIIVRGAGDKVVFWNRGAEETYGWTPEEAMGQVAYDILETRFPKPLAEIAADVALKGRWEGELIHTRKDGREIVVASRWAAQRDESGGQVGVLEINRDITERKRAEEALTAAKNSAEQAKAVAEQANRTKDHFLAVLSHELRTPLTPVVMGLSMLQNRSDLDPALRQTLEMARRHVELEARLVDDLLDVSRIARGKIELSRVAVELCTIIQRAVEVCKPDIEARRLRFDVDLGPAAPYWIDADTARLQQVFWNLLKNAIKFTPHGGRVGIRCRPNEEHVLVEVNDSGIGIEPDALSRIFNAFEQAELSITRHFGGLGLGLAISKALVELHGGEISAHSEGRDKGATFRVRLPLCAAVSRPPPSAPRPRLVRPLHILLVEDHGVTAQLMRMVLTADGHTVESAGDVATALELAGRQAFDLLVSDLGLPDGSGHDLMRQLRERGYKFPGIALSGYGQEEDIRRSHEAGFAAHLTKPASRDEIAEAVATVVSRD